MAFEQINKFGGMLPAWADHLLPDGQASNSINIYPFSGALEGWRQPKLLRALTNSAAKYAYRVPTNEAIDSTISASADWLEFTDPDTNVLRTPVVDDQYDRYYMASPSMVNVSGISGPQYNTHDRIKAGQDNWLLGVPQPACALGVEVTGGGDTATLGNDISNSTATSTVNTNYCYLLPITPTGAMSLSDVTFLPETTNTDILFFAVLYADDGAGNPGQLMNVGVTTRGMTAGTNAVAYFTNPTGLLSNVNYWIGIMADTDFDMQVGGDTACTFFSQPYGNGASLAPNGPWGTGPAFYMYGDLTTSDILEARAYAYTWVTEYGEEGPPSEYTLVNGWSNGTWTITLWTPDAADMGTNRNITTLRLYRTVPDQGGQTVYYWVADIPVGTATYTDTETDDVIALNSELPSTTFYPPPTDLQGISMMPNGIMVGFRSNELWFSEPFYPHAWPPAYVQTVDYPIVGIGVSGQSVVAATTGMPTIASGVNPSSLTLTQVPLREPCMSRGSVLGTEHGVYYVSPNGLILVTPNTQSASSVTEGWITREKWSANVTPVGTRAIALAGCYFAYNDTDQTGFFMRMGEDSKSFSIWPQPGGHRIGFNKLTSPNGYNMDNLTVDPWTGIPLVVQNGEVYYMDFTDQSPTIIPYTYKSKEYHQKTNKNFAVIQLFFSIPASTPTQNATRKTTAFSDASWDTLDNDRYGYVKIWADGVLVTVREIRTDKERLRIVSGFKAERWSVEVISRVVINEIQIATSVQELGVK